MKNPVIVVGMGEMGSVLARGFLRLGYPVHSAPARLERALEQAHTFGQDVPQLKRIASSQ